MFRYVERFLAMQSHASYSRCGLGSEATDRLVALTRAESATAIGDGRSPALFGAKITGGGSGGEPPSLPPLGVIHALLHVAISAHLGTAALDSH